MLIIYLKTASLLIELTDHSIVERPVARIRVARASLVLHQALAIEVLVYNLRGDWARRRLRDLRCESGRINAQAACKHGRRGQAVAREGARSWPDGAAQGCQHHSSAQEGQRRDRCPR
eukprot:3377048-Pleurochrysis_carterae.AAC.3